MTVVAPYRDRDRWLERRRAGIGGSDIAALLGVEGAYLTPLEVWRSKVEGRQGDAEATGRMLRGTRLEDEAFRVFCETQGRRGRRMPLRNHPTVPWLFADVDRVLYAERERGLKAAGLEIKVPGYSVYRRCRDEGLPEAWIAQAQHEMLCCGWDRLWIGVFHPESWSILAFEVEAVPELQEAIVSVAGDFWARYVMPGVPPPPGYAAPPVEVVHLPAVTAPGVTDMANPYFPRWRDAAEAMRLAKEVTLRLKEIEDEALAALKEMMDDYGAEVGVGDGVRVTRVRRKGRVTKHWDNLKATKPLDAVKVAAALQEAGVGVSPIDLGACRVDFTEFETEGPETEHLRVTVTEDRTSAGPASEEDRDLHGGSDILGALLAGPVSD